MNALKNVFPLFITLFICTLDGYSMMNYRLPAKRAYGCFAAVTVFCLAVNSYIAIHYGSLTLRNVILFTIGIPYFILILLITKDKISQTVFNFWLWINVYEIIANFSAFIDDYTLRNYYFLTAIRFALFCGYFVLYNKYLRAKHQSIMAQLNVNWWIFSFIPLSFTVLIYLVNYYFEDSHGLSRNYPILLVIHLLMLSVYVLIFYTFKTVHDAMEGEKLAQSMKDQIALQKKQHDFYLQKTEAERIFRHDARHRDTILLNYLEEGNVQKAKDLLHSELTEIQTTATVQLCDNPLINAILSEYRTKAQNRGLEFSTEIQLPHPLTCDEAEFCVMLSNLLENSLDAAKSYIQLEIKPLNHQLSLNIKNDYDGAPKKDSDGGYLTTKQHGMGLGLKSVNAILKNNHGFLKINDENGIFNVFATLKN